MIVENGSSKIYFFFQVTDVDQPNFLFLFFPADYDSGLTEVSIIL